MFTEKEREILKNYVSNIDGNVYTIFNLPEEVVAVIFAYVSRSDKSFKENLLKLISDGIIEGNNVNMLALHALAQEKATKFHERWVVGYGHSSVAENATAHVGVEKVSRLASAELELANNFNSFTEYSQRYQKPKRGDFYVPSGFSEEDKARYLEYNNRLYDFYEEIYKKLVDFMTLVIPVNEGEPEKAYRTRIEKLAFEDARYVLPLSTFTNLGMTGNGKGLRDAIVNLLTSPYGESVKLGESLTNEIKTVMPTLLRHVKKDEAKEKALLKAVALGYPFLTKFEENPENTFHSDMDDVTLLPISNEDSAMTLLIHSLLVSEHNMPPYGAYKALEGASYLEKAEFLDAITRDLKPYSNPIDHFRQLNYRVYFCVSEATWHQLLRHNRGATFIYQKPTMQNGYETPPSIVDADLGEIFDEAMAFAHTEFEYFANKYENEADYLVTNAHRRGVLMTCTAWELFHLFNLRTSPEAQWSIRRIFTLLYDQLKKAHPVIFRYARRRLKPEDEIAKSEG